MGNDDPDDPWTTESQESWYPDTPTQVSIEVDWSPPEMIGELWLPDDTGTFQLEQYHETRVFGFARWLEEQGEE